MPLMYQRDRTACIVYALLSVALCWSAQALTVHHNYQGNWTALFQTGDRHPIPRVLESENVYKFDHTRGYDGQFYHYVAHDPLLTKGFSKHVDDPRLRWRRILVPGLAFLAAGGQQRLVDRAYLGVTLCFVSWVRIGSPAIAACMGYIPPGTLLLSCSGGGDFSRTTDDRRRSGRPVRRICGLRGPAVVEISGCSRACPLARETGIGLILACGLAGLMKRSWGLTAAALASTLPWLVWLVGFVHPATRPDPFFWLSRYPFKGNLWADAPTSSQLLAEDAGAWAAAFDYVAVLGMWLALGQAVMVVRSGKLDPAKLATATYALPVIFVSSFRVWSEAYAFGRVFSPLLIFLVFRRSVAAPGGGCFHSAWWRCAWRPNWQPICQAS